MSGGGTLSPGIGTHWDASSRWLRAKTPGGEETAELGADPSRDGQSLKLQCSCRFLMNVGWPEAGFNSARKSVLRYGAWQQESPDRMTYGL